MIVNNKFKIGQSVYLKTDPEQFERIVFGIYVQQSGLIYELACGEKTSKHFDFEITSEINELKKIDNI